MQEQKPKQTILLVDDDPNFRQLLSEILSPCGFFIAEAASAEEALEQLSGNVCLAIVDFRLQQMDGMTFISKMRERFPRTPVVFVSGSFCDARTFNWLRNILHVSLILQKPIEPKIFLQQLEGLLPKIDRSIRDEPTLVNIPALKVEELIEQQIDHQTEKLLAKARAAEAQTETTTDTKSEELTEKTSKKIGKKSEKTTGKKADKQSTKTSDRKAAATEKKPQRKSKKTTEKSTLHAAQKASTTAPDTSFDEESPKPITKIDSEETLEQKWRHLPEDLTTPEVETNEDLLAQLQQMRRKLEAESRIRAAQLQLRKAIPPDWEQLSSLIDKIKSDPHNQLLIKEALDLSHRLRGTAGSLGLNRVSACASKIENCLGIIGPENEQEFLWAEIFRALADGETGLRLAEALDRNEDNTKGFSVGNVLIIADEKKFRESIVKLNPYVSADFVFANSATDAVMKASSYKFDSAIMDLGKIPVGTLAQLTRELRMISNNANLAMACCTADSDLPNASTLAYLGISATAKFPMEQDKFEALLRELSHPRQMQQPRVLSVDDDKVLTSFIETILQGIGMNVHALNEPIHILEAIEEVDPDLLLLDVMMPGLSGFDVCRTLRDHPRWHTIPILFLTSKSDAQGRAAAFQAGGSDLLSKPILSEELIARVRTQIDLSLTRRQSVTLDGSTGTFKQDVFIKRSKEALDNAIRQRKAFVLSLIRINSFEQLAAYGLFSQMNIVSVLGRLLCSRFTADVMRGRFDDQTFAVGITCEDEDAAIEALQAFANEVQQMSFMVSFSDRVDINVSVASVAYGKDSNTVEGMIKKCEVKLA